MAGASVVQFMSDKLCPVLAEKLKEEVSVVVTFKQEFESIYQEVLRIKFLLNDAGEWTNYETMANWLQNLRDALTDAMDLVEECKDDDNAHNSISKNPIFNHPIGHQIIFLDQMCGQLIFRYQKGREIKELKNRVDKIDRTGNQYLEYLKSLVDVNTFSEQGKTNSNSPLVKNDQIVRMQVDIEVITKKL